jgi:hypothetical protein
LHRDALLPGFKSRYSAPPGEQRGQPEFGGLKLFKSRQANLRARRTSVAGFELKVFSQGDGARDEQISVFEKNDELVALRRFNLVLSTNRSDGLPSQLDGTTKTVLMVLGEAMPESGALGLARREVNDGFEERRELGVARSDG